MINLTLDTITWNIPNAKRLSRIEVDISRHYQQNMFKPESKYKILLNDLMNEKFLIEQKLHQSYLNQMNHLFKLKLSILENKCCNQYQQKNVIIKKSAKIKSCEKSCHDEHNKTSPKRYPDSENNDNKADNEPLNSVSYCEL